MSLWQSTPKPTRPCSDTPWELTTFNIKTYIRIYGSEKQRLVHYELHQQFIYTFFNLIFNLYINITKKCHNS